MSTTNQIYEFGATAAAENILSNAAYSADAGRLSGHEPGIARQELENAALRNLSRFAKGIAAWIASHYGPGVVDDGDDAKIAAGLAAAVAAVAPAPAQATTTAQGIVELATNAEAIAGTDTERAITPAALAARLGTVTVEEYYIDGGALTPAITDGAAMALAESSTNKLTRNILSFQGSTKDTHGAFNFRAPSNWDGGTVKAKVLWNGATGCSAGDDVEFYVAMAAVRDGDDLDPALGSAVTIHDTVNTGATKLNISPASAAITPAGTLAAGCLLLGRLSRNYDYGAQPLSEAAQVDGLVLQFGITGPIVAW